MEKRVDFSLSLLFFWLKGFISVDSHVVKAVTVNTILGFIPAGKDSQSIPLKNISSARVSTKYKIKNILGGIFLFLASFSLIIEHTFWGILLMILSIGIAGSGIVTILTIQRSGSNFRLSVPFFDKKKMLKAKKMIEKALIKDIDKTDLNGFFEKKPAKKARKKVRKKPDSKTNEMPKKKSSKQKGKKSVKSK